MALIISDRVKELTTTAGTGTITLAGAPAGFASFSVVGNGNTCYYAIVGTTEWEVGLGTYTSSGTTLARNTVYTSSNSNQKVTFSAGTKEVFLTYPAISTVTPDDIGTAANELPLNQYLGILAYQSQLGLYNNLNTAPTIVSASTIQPVAPIQFVSGTTAIVTITVPPEFAVGGGQLTLIPTGIWTTTTAGNIALASTAVVSRAVTMFYDAATAKWYPSY